jgi:uncharacterized protein YxeA
VKFKKHRLLGIIILILVITLSFYSYKSYSDNQFINSCTSLNDKNLTLENLNTLDGKVYEWNIDNYPPGGIKPTTLEEKHLEQYKNSFKKALDNNSNHIQVLDDQSFNITQEDLDNTWICNIKLNSEQKLITNYKYIAY